MKLYELVIQEEVFMPTATSHTQPPPTVIHRVQADSLAEAVDQAAFIEGELVSVVKLGGILSLTH